MIGRELVKRGVEVSAVVPRRQGQKRVEMLDGIRVLSFPWHRPLAATRLIRECNADIYHSQHTSFATYLAVRAMPQRKHIATCRDPKELRDWLLELRNPSLNKVQVLLNWAYEDGPFTRVAVRRLDGVFAAAPSIVSVIKRKFDLQHDVELLATPVRLNPVVRKAEHPTVCFVGRWDRRKRPEMFFELARAFPHVRFLAAGRSRDVAWEAELRERYASIPNLTLLGFIDQFESGALERLLSESWILVNTSVREGLPTSFLEALASQCALLSSVNPGGMTERFGEHVADGNFSHALDRLLAGDAWRARGEAGWQYVQEHFELDAVIDRHVSVYDRLMAGA